MFGTFGQQNPFNITMPKRNTFCQPQCKQPITFGQQPTAHPLTFGQPQCKQPLTFGQQPTAQALTFGQQPTAQPVTFVRSGLTFGQQPTAQALTFGQSQTTTQPLTFGQPQTTAQPLTFGQPQTTAQPLTFGQPGLTFDQLQPTAHPFKKTETIHEYSVPETIVYARVVYDIGTRQNYDHMSGEEYLLQNDLSLSIDYCEKIQRELQKKNKYSL